MPSPTTGLRETAVAPHLRRLVDFAEPIGTDICLDLACGSGPVPAALMPRVRHVTAVDASLARRGDHSRSVGSGPDGRTPTVLFRTGPQAHIGDPDAPTVRASAAALPYRDGTFSLVTSRFSLHDLGDPALALREMIRVCRPNGRVIIAEVVRPNRDRAARERLARLERLRDPAHPGTPSVAALTEMISAAGGRVRRLDVFAVERPVEPWLAGARSRGAAEQIRRALVLEVDGGPKTGARPRVIGGELWFTQSWAHLAAQPTTPR